MLKPEFITMNHLLLTRIGRGLCLGVALLLTLTIRSANAACGPDNLSDACSDSFGLRGNLSAVSNPGSATLSVLTNAQLPTAGNLFYDDYKDLEAQARRLLERNMKFREDISPYRETNKFDDLVRRFDTINDFGEIYDDPDQEIIAMPLQERIDKADTELRQARDLYAYLLVYAPVERMRLDSTYSATLCANAEDPNPPDPTPTNSGQVKSPVLDWCDFGARLRQSVREAAYLRMIFAQQYMVNALGMGFGGTLLGGEAFVLKEKANLEAARYQFALAQKGLTEALSRPLGSGCLVSDFYTQTEWALLSRAAQGQETAQHQIATRLSYLGINAAADIPRAQAAARDAFRIAATEGYIKLIGTAGMNAVPQATAGCPMDARPDGALVAEMTLNLLATRAKAREMADGRNIFGYDLRFTPTNPFHDPTIGLWELAKADADLALTLQDQLASTTRDFDLDQTALSTAVKDTSAKIDAAIGNATGCYRDAFNNVDAVWHLCISEMIKNTTTCDPMADSFDSCMNRTIPGGGLLIKDSGLRKARQSLRIAWLGVAAAILQRDNLIKRADNETMRNTQVQSAILTGAQKKAAHEAAIAAANCCTITFKPFPSDLAVNFGAFYTADRRPKQILDEAATQMTIDDLNAQAVIRNFFYDMAEAQGDIDIAIQQFNATLTEFNALVQQIENDLFQSKREHAYIVALPANDPSYRMLRDSLRLDLAAQLEKAARGAYLAARRAEYEYAARLSASNFPISDIYKARTANNILTFLNDLNNKIAKLPGADAAAQVNQRDITLSVAHHLLGLTDQFLLAQGVPNANLESERTQRFRQWVAQNTQVDDDTGKPKLVFTFSTSAASKGLISQVVSGYGGYWLHKVGGIGTPKPTSSGVGLNLTTEQTGALNYRAVDISQSGQVGLTSFAGCLFDYRLLPTALLEGFDFPTNQPTEVVPSKIFGDINNQHPTLTTDYRTSAFLGRPLGANEWQIVIYAGSPDGIQPELNLQQLTNIELKISTTYASRQAGVPTPSDCVRIDF